ncbi:alanine racemase [Flexivirga meconopsidis]|uniref:alanine racemase n=1 Tax=Flexivirga meconopsidis TaxID=2977121 RepID=UPI002240D7C6|nr:alanine racemase [Flexivirga meconopsidis]
MTEQLWSSIEAIGAPAAVLDVDAAEHNVAEMRRRASGTPIRVASKSIRVRGLIERMLREPGYAGVLAYSAAEAAWLARSGVDDVLIAYPTVDVETIKQVAAEPALAARVTFMADLPEHVRLLDSAASGTPLRVCLDVDASLQVGKTVLGAHRSSVHSASEAAEFARATARLDGVRLVGLMFYDAQVAGVQDTNPAVRLLKRRSVAELATRRERVFRAVSSYSSIEVVNAGGTGSLHLVGGAPVTEFAAGSGLFVPTLFDRYDGADLQPAAYFVSPVVRKPRPDVAVTFSGGYSASGASGPSRVPRPVHPEGLRYFGQEGAGEVQTPLRGAAARDLEIGDPVWFRHAKAGEMCERFNEILLVRDGSIVDRLPTYRGEGQNFG